MTTAKETYEMFNTLSSKGYEAAQELGEINLRAVGKLMSRQMDAMSILMETGLRQVKMATEAKGYNDLIKGQLDLAREVGERVMNESRENVKLAGDTRDEYRGWVEKRVQNFSDNLRKVQPAA